MILVGVKSDLSREVSFEEGLASAMIMECSSYIETSTFKDYNFKDFILQNLSEKID